MVHNDPHLIIYEMNYFTRCQVLNFIVTDFDAFSFASICVGVTEGKTVTTADAVTSPCTGGLPHAETNKTKLHIKNPMSFKQTLPALLLVCGSIDLSIHLSTMYQ